VVGHLVKEVYLEAEQITLVQDNLSAHAAKALCEVYLLCEVYSPERVQRIL
jgi:hypothetical protein